MKKCVTNERKLVAKARIALRAENPRQRLLPIGVSVSYPKESVE
jgi:hypothetical protein